MQIAPLDQTFRLHSNPGSSKTLYLDFREVVDFERDPTTMSKAEHLRVQAVWRKIADHFAGVNVTTERPAARKTMHTSVQTGHGATVVITRNIWCSPDPGQAWRAWMLEGVAPRIAADGKCS